ncbi:MAG TPA: hypothetical protein VGG71_12300 [Chitinophagaceae bacterium]
MPSADTIAIDTIIQASTEAMWKAWMEPSIILKWFGSDPNGKGLKARWMSGLADVLKLHLLMPMKPNTLVSAFITK